MRATAGFGYNVRLVSRVVRVPRGMVRPARGAGVGRRVMNASEQENAIGPVSPAGRGPDEAARDRLRAAHGVRLIAATHEGLGLDKQPNGVFGFVSAPAVPQAPLYARPIYQSYEAHKRPDGTVLMLGYVTPDVARGLQEATDVIHARVFFAPQGAATVLVAIRYDRIRSHKEHSQRSGEGLQLDLDPLAAATS